MLSAVDSLQGAKFSTAINQERDALRFLMEARETVQQNLLKQPKAVRAKARAFDRLQRQKLRRPNEKDQTLPQIAEDLGKLAEDEDEVARMIAPGNNPMDGDGAGAGKPADTKPNQAAAGKPDPDNPEKDPAASDKPGPAGDRKVAGKEGKAAEDPAQERQEDIAGRAAAIEKEAATAKGLTGLARKRIGDAARSANAGADALGQKDRPGARKEVDRARELFRLAAKQVRITGRNAQGVHLVKLEEGEKVRAVARLAEGTEEEEGPNGNGNNEAVGDDE